MTAPLWQRALQARTTPSAEDMLRDPRFAKLLARRERELAKAQSVAAAARARGLCTYPSCSSPPRAGHMRCAAHPHGRAA